MSPSRCVTRSTRQQSGTGRIVTEIAPLPAFYPAEAEHHDYFALHPGAGYCRVVIAPKVAKFRKAFRDRLKQGAA